VSPVRNQLFSLPYPLSRCNSSPDAFSILSRSDVFSRDSPNYSRTLPTSRVKSSVTTRSPSRSIWIPRSAHDGIRNAQLVLYRSRKWEWEYYSSLLLSYNRSVCKLHLWFMASIIDHLSRVLLTPPSPRWLSTAPSMAKPNPDPEIDIERRNQGYDTRTILATPAERHFLFSHTLCATLPGGDEERVA
jgi:hypothetical protein